MLQSAASRQANARRRPHTLLLGTPYALATTFHVSKCGFLKSKIEASDLVRLVFEAFDQNSQRLVVLMSRISLYYSVHDDHPIDAVEASVVKHVSQAIVFNAACMRDSWPLRRAGDVLL